MTRAVIYARVSSEGERQNTDRQVADLTRYADAASTAVVRVFTEKASGADDERPVLAECLDWCVAGNADTLLVSEVSRLGRTVKVIVDAVDRLTKAGVNIHIHNIAVDTLLPDGKENPIGTVAVTLLAVGAKMERDNIMDRLNSGRQLAIERGVKMGRKVGYRLSNREIVAKYPKVARKLKEGFSVRETAAVCGVSPSTVQKVNKAIKVLKG